MVDATLLPSNARPQETALDCAAAARIGRIDLSVLRRLKDPETCPADLLPWLAWEYSVDTWSADLTEAHRRAVIAAAPALHRIKGTPAAVRLALEAIGLAGVEIQEGRPVLYADGSWIANGSEVLHGGHWALFSVEADLGKGGLDTGRIAQIKQAITRAKNARSHLYALAFQANARVIGGPATDTLRLFVDLRASRAKGVCDGRYRAFGTDQKRCDGSWIADGSHRANDIYLTAGPIRAERAAPPLDGPALYAGAPAPDGAAGLPYGEILERRALTVEITAARAGAPNVGATGRLRADGSWRPGGYVPGPRRAPLRVVRELRADGKTHPCGWGPPCDGSWSADGRQTAGTPPLVSPWIQEIAA